MRDHSKRILLCAKVAFGKPEKVIAFQKRKSKLAYFLILSLLLSLSLASRGGGRNVHRLHFCVGLGVFAYFFFPKGVGGNLGIFIIIFSPRSNMFIPRAFSGGDPKNKHIL